MYVLNRTRLSQLRQQKGWTLVHLAYMVGVSNKTVGRWESGRSQPRRDAYENLARVFGVEIEELRIPAAELGGAPVQDRASSPRPRQGVRQRVAAALRQLAEWIVG